MNADITLQTTRPDGKSFVAWAPVKATIELNNTNGAGQGPINTTLRNAGAPQGGRLLFAPQRTTAGASELQLYVPVGGSVEFWVAGEFKHPSTNYGDAAIEAVVNQNASIGRRELMVRIRKNAVTLTPAERDRFLVALAKLNDAGQGPFQAFRDTHVAESIDEAHGYPAFPPWHRAYLLDLERSLQLIDPSVTLPYWRFDEPAAALFAPEFLGMPSPNPDDGDVIQFPSGHPLETWKTDNKDSIERRPQFAITDAPPQEFDGRPWVISQADTLALGSQYADFRNLEGAPHGNAHVSFQGPISSVPTAAKDPLFFLLHANVDRLWAFWQWLNHRTDATDPQTYSLAGAQRVPNDIGHKLADTMWPWNGSTAPPRPTFPPPRPSFPAPSAGFLHPSAQPAVRDMIDYQGVHGTASLGFDYDDVPFEL